MFVSLDRLFRLRIILISEPNATTTNDNYYTILISHARLYHPATKDRVTASPPTPSLPSEHQYEYQAPTPRFESSS